jgi:hypothetical protein
MACYGQQHREESNMMAIQEMREAFKGQFMQPVCYRGRDIEEALIDSGMDYEEDGIYCRLSADGYLDCTDWHGPFATIEDAARFLVDTYAD